MAHLEARLENELDSFRRMHKPSNGEGIYYEVSARDGFVQVSIRIGDGTDGRTSTYGLTCEEFGYSSVERLRADTAQSLESLGIRKEGRFSGVRRAIANWNPLGIDSSLGLIPRSSAPDNI